MPNHVTMTDSTGYKLWHMSCRNRMTNRGVYTISKGWREFAYDHSLKLKDKLVFTPVSPSHFFVEYTTGGMRPTRDGKKSPSRNRGRDRRTWPVNNPENVHGVAPGGHCLATHEQADCRWRNVVLLVQHIKDGE